MVVMKEDTRMKAGRYGSMQKASLQQSRYATRDLRPKRKRKPGEKRFSVSCHSTLAWQRIFTWKRDPTDKCHPIFHSCSIYCDFSIFFHSQEKAQGNERKHFVIFLFSLSFLWNLFIVSELQELDVQEFDYNPGMHVQSHPQHKWYDKIHFAAPFLIFARLSGSNFTNTCSVGQSIWGFMLCEPIYFRFCVLLVNLF